MTDQVRKGEDFGRSRRGGRRGPPGEMAAGEAGGAAGLPGVGRTGPLVEQGEGGLGPGGDVADGPINGGVAGDLAEDGDVAGQKQGRRRRGPRPAGRPNPSASLGWSTSAARR